MGAVAARDIARLASGARAGPSCRLEGVLSGPVGARAAHAPRAAPTCVPSSVLSSSSSSSLKATSSVCSSNRLPARRVRGSTRCAGLAQLDYLWYQEMPQEDVNEDYLWDRLEPLLGYLKPWERVKVREGLSMAYDAHEGQFRKSGEKFISHPVEVARILAELRMDAETLIAGLLHDTVEDTAVVSFEEIEAWFGPAVRKIVEGETKFSKLPRLKEAVISGTERPTDIKALDLQQLFLAMTEEVRIVVVKLADRLHNMRTLGSLPPHKQARIARETLTVFAPLARLLGLYAIKEELEETSLMYAAPEAYAQVKRRLDELARDQEELVMHAQKTVEAALAADPHLAAAISTVAVVPKQKSVYSLYRKLAGKPGLTSGGMSAMPRALSAGATGGLRDVAQLQIVLSTREDGGGGLGDLPLCYHVLGRVHALFAPIPGTIKDYIATPKPNGYASLHTTVLPLGLATTGDALIPLELQIRTDRMHKLADYGIAADNWLASPMANGAAASIDNAAWDAAADDGAADDGAAADNGAAAPWPSTLPSPYGALPGGANGRSRIPCPEAEAAAGNGHSGAGALTADGAAARERRVNWLGAIREWQEEFLGSLSAREFVDCVTGDLLGQGVFVFTPAGDILRLPRGATVLDFAYHVHTDLGNQMVAAKVNGVVVGADHVLRNAEVVEVVAYDGPPTAAAVQRHRRWAAGLTTRTAKHKLAKFLRENEHLTAGMPEEESPPRLLAGVNGAGLIPELVRHNMTWLIVDCEDRSGLLAAVAGAIARARHNIHAHSGNSGAAGGTFLMNYLLEGEPAEVPGLCAALDGMPHVRSWAIGCGLPPPPADADEAS